MRKAYRVVLQWDEDDKAWNVIVPAIEGCFTFGATVDEALQNAREAIRLNLEDMAARGEPIPEDETRLETVMVEI